MKNTTVFIITSILATSQFSPVFCKGENFDSAGDVVGIAIGSTLLSAMSAASLADDKKDEDIAEGENYPKLKERATFAQAFSAINNMHLYGSAEEIAWSNLNNIAGIKTAKEVSEEFRSKHSNYGQYLFLRMILGICHATFQASARKCCNIRHGFYYRFAHALSQVANIGELILNKPFEGKRGVLLLSRILYLLYSSHNTHKMLKDPLLLIDALPNRGHNGKIIADKRITHTTYSYSFFLGGMVPTTHERIHDIHPEGGKQYIALFDGDKGIYIPLDDPTNGQHFKYSYDDVECGAEVDLAHALIPLNGYKIRFADLTKERLLKLAQGLGVIRMKNIDDIEFSLPMDV
jgi:hypothetical protein